MNTLTKAQYIKLREERNSLRDTYEKSSNFQNYSSIKKRIQEIDKQLSQYEKSMRKYKDLTIHEKLNVKQYAIDINGDKRLHSCTPDWLNQLSPHAIVYILSVGRTEPFKNKY